MIRMKARIPTIQPGDIINGFCLLMFLSTTTSFLIQGL